MSAWGRVQAAEVYSGVRGARGRGGVCRSGRLPRVGESGEHQQPVGPHPTDRDGYGVPVTVGYVGSVGPVTVGYTGYVGYELYPRTRVGRDLVGGADLRDGRCDEIRGGRHGLGLAVAGAQQQRHRQRQGVALAVVARHAR